MLRHLALSTFLFLVHFCMAQPVVGIKAGVDRSVITVAAGTEVFPGTPDPTAEGGWGYHGGAFAEIKLHEKWFLRPELVYAQRSHAYAVVFDSTLLGITARVEADVDVKRSYLEVPLLLGYRVSEKFSVMLGPSVGYLLGNNAVTTGAFTVGGFFPGFSLPFSDSNNTTTGLNELRLSLVGGFAFRTTSGFEVGMRYCHGLGYLESDTNVLRTRASVIQLAVGYAFLR